MIKLKKILEEGYNLIKTEKKFLFSGTLLGCVRNHDIIPYDDDIDIGIYIESEMEMINIMKQIKNDAPLYDFKVIEVHFGLKLIKFNLSFDIFFLKKYNDNTIRYVSKKGIIKWPKVYFLDKELDIFIDGYIDNIRYNIPNNSDKIMERWYGKNWKKYYITHNHDIDTNNLQFKKFIDINSYLNMFIIKFLNIINYNQVN